jgi:hypothetical protein
MSHNKNIFLSIFMSLLFCNQVDAMKRARENQMQDTVVVATVVQSYHLSQVVSLLSQPQLPAKQYWDGKSPYDGSQIIKATSDHDCKHCNKKIIDESLAAHTFKHSDIYYPQPQKKLKIDVIETSDESSDLSRILSSRSSKSSESSSSSEESSSSSSDSSSSFEDFSELPSSSASLSDSSEDAEDNKPRFVTKTLKHGRTVQHVACDIDGCRFSCARSEEMNNHKKLHGVDNCYICKKCHFRADKRIVFENHVQRHLPIKKRSNTAQCKICGRMLSKPSSLARHIQRKICDKVLKKSNRK